MCLFFLQTPCVGAVKYLTVMNRRVWRGLHTRYQTTTQFTSLKSLFDRRMQALQILNTSFTFPLEKMNTFLLTCLYLSFTYVHASLPPRPPQPLFSDQRERFRAPTLSFGNNLIISLTLLSLPEVRLHLVMVSESQTERSCSISVSNNTGVRAGRETPVWQCIVFN